MNVDDCWEKVNMLPWEKFMFLEPPHTCDSDLDKIIFKIAGYCPYVFQVKGKMIKNIIVRP